MENKDKDIGFICDLYSNNSEIINTTNENRISTLEDSITTSLINNRNIKTNICYEEKNTLCNFCAILLCLAAVIILIYIIVIYNC
jgi:hypothetical protein